MQPFHLPSQLILPSDYVDTLAVPGCDAPEVLRPDESAKPSAADDSGNKLDWRSTVSVTAELLRGVADGPLKSVAGGLCVILENCAVWPPFRTFNAHCLLSFQQTGVDRRAIEWLAPRVKTLSKSLCAPIPQGDVNKKERTRKLEQ